MMPLLPCLDPSCKSRLDLTSLEEAPGHACKAVCLQGSFCHSFLTWEKVITLLASGKLDLLRMMGRIENFANWRTCFEETRAGEIVKAVVKPARTGA